MNYVASIENILFYDLGIYYENNILHGYVNINHYNPTEDTVEGISDLNIILYDSLGYVVRQEHLTGNPVSISPHGWVYETIDWSIQLTGRGTGYYVRIQSGTDASVYSNSSPFEIVKILSSEKKILLYGFRVADNPLLPADIWGIVNHVTKTISISVPSETVVTALKPYYTVSYLATAVPVTGAVDDFTLPVIYTITAEDLSVDYYEATVTISVITGVPNLFIYDNEITRVSPLELERGRKIKYFVLISNSGSLTSLADTLHVTLHDSESITSISLPDIPIDPVLYNSDVLKSGEYTIPDDIPIGSGIDYMLTFQLVSSIVSRHFVIARWNTDSQTIVYNKNSKAFIRESIVVSKMYARINKSLYTLKDGTYGTFYLHTDLLADGQILMYDREFEPSITFVINKFAFEKVFDTIVAQVGSVGVKQIEYWTDKQYSKHIWPINPLSQVQTRPWIDPEYREDRWYFPIHNELLFRTYSTVGSQANLSTVLVSTPIDITIPASGKISINGIEYSYSSFTGSTFTLSGATGITIAASTVVTVINDDSVPTREMRGMYLKVKITFKAKYKFTLKNILTEFRPSNT